MTKKPISVEALKHDVATRKNIPTAEYESVMREEEKAPVRLAYERRNKDLDPQLVWRGKDEQDWSDLIVSAPPLYIQEKVHPKVIIDDLRRRSAQWRVAGGQTMGHKSPATDHQPDLFADFNGLKDKEAATEFYQHDQHWSNRMISGDSLSVMASLAEREGLRGQVQCIYFDPPYGIKFNSNFQWSTTSHDVKDGAKDQITREPEQVRAFRDTWKDGIHSYLTYLRDRLTVARDLLHESGSIFVQIGDENVHRVRALMDEVFGEENFVSEICAQKTGSQPGPIGNVSDYILWFSKNKKLMKSRKAFLAKTGEEGDFSPDPLTSDGATPSGTISYEFQGELFHPGIKAHWKTTVAGLNRLTKADRIIRQKRQIRLRKFWEDNPVKTLTNIWNDSGGATNVVYVVQTSDKLIQRCILMTTDPGDLVLDPTCGSGTTAYVAEQWGRRWITIDTSRVAIALARSRLMGARYPYYLLADSPEGQRKEGEVTRTPPKTMQTRGDIRHGFVYERVPHITLKSIANNTEIDVIWDKWERELAPLRAELNKLLGTDWEEWQIPRELPEPLKTTKKTLGLDIGTESLGVAMVTTESHKITFAESQARKVHSDWWQARIARQKEIDASIAAKADNEYLYDKPYADTSRVRVAGPFTVESLSPHRTLAVDWNDELVDTLEAVEGKRKVAEKGDAVADFAHMILENLKTAGVQQAHKEDRISFTALTGWPGRFICAEGLFMEGDRQKRAGIFIGPEFGTVSRPDLVAAAREAGDAGFDVLIACAFNYDAHSAEFDKLGRVPVLKARMNPDLHMGDDLKATGAGNLFVIFGEPDMEVVSGQWLVTRNGRMVMHYERFTQFSGFGSLEEINRLGGDDLPRFKRLAAGREVWADKPDQTRGGVDPVAYRGGGGAARNAGLSAFSGGSEGIAGGGRDASGHRAEAGIFDSGGVATSLGAGSRNRTHALGPHEITALESLSASDFPLSLTTDHWTQVTVHGVDVFKPQTGEVMSEGTDGIALWMLDTDYNEESFFVRHAYFLGANDPYKALKTTLKAEIDQEAWDSLHSDTSRPFAKPASGRIAVKVINHLGDEVMKVFGVE